MINMHSYHTAFFRALARLVNHGCSWEGKLIKTCYVIYFLASLIPLYYVQHGLEGKAPPCFFSSRLTGSYGGEWAFQYGMAWHEGESAGRGILAWWWLEQNEYEKGKCYKSLMVSTDLTDSLSKLSSLGGKSDLLQPWMQKDMGRHKHCVSTMLCHSAELHFVSVVNFI